MLRRTTYRTAANLFLFLGLWFVLGAIVLWSPLPGALGIASELFSAWLVLFFLIMGVAGVALVAAATNASRGGPQRTTHARAALRAGDHAAARVDGGPPSQARTQQP